MHDDDLREIGRALGFDFAKFGVELWDGARELPGVSEGYAQRKAGSGRHKKDAGRFVRKWLQLRVGALHRRKVVDDGVNAEFIRTIDDETCPVTLETLTHAENSDSDWSVDRVNNNAGYAVDNIVVMSRRANEAKGSKSLCEVVELSHSAVPAHGLTPRQWLRMASLMYGAYAIESPRLVEKHLLLPLATRIPRYSVRLRHQQFQLLLLHAASSFENRKFVNRKLNACLSDQRWSEVDVMIDIVGRALPTCEYRFDALVNEALQERRAAFFKQMSLLEHQALREFLVALLGGKKTSRKHISTWALDSRGLLH